MRSKLRFSEGRASTDLIARRVSVAERWTSVTPQILRVIQEERYKWLGSDTWHETNFRLIAATSRDRWVSTPRGPSMFASRALGLNHTVQVTIWLTGIAALDALNAFYRGNCRTALPAHVELIGPYRVKIEVATGREAWRRERIASASPGNDLLSVPSRSEIEAWLRAWRSIPGYCAASED